MIPAKITSLNPPQVTWYGLPEPDASKYHDYDLTLYGIAYGRYLDSQFIADVENIHLCKEDGTAISYGQCWRLDEGEYKTGQSLSLNQLCQIELTGEGKCKIIKL